MRNFRKLKVWEEGHQLTLDVYRTTKSFPKEELYSLTNQIQRSAYSIPTNIAEGCGRRTDADFKQFLHISLGSANELEYQLLLVCDLGYITNEIYQPLYEKTIQVKKMLINLIGKLES